MLKYFLFFCCLTKLQTIQIYCFVQSLHCSRSTNKLYLFVCDRIIATGLCIRQTLQMVHKLSTSYPDNAVVANCSRIPFVAATSALFAV